jgi:hypothetical protein
MALKLKCRCSEQLSAPESAIGKRGKCSKCGMVFVIPGPKRAVPAAGPPVAARRDDLGLDLPDLGGSTGLSSFGDLLDDALKEPAPATREPAASSAAEKTAASARRRGSSRAQMGVLANGIKLVFWGTLIGMTSIIFSILAALMSPALILVAVGVSLLGGVLSTIGRIVCLGAPSQVGGKGLLIGAVACDLASIGIAIAGAFGESELLARAISQVLWLATLILFVLFLRVVATSIGQEHLADSAQSVIVLVVIAIVTIIGMVVVPIFGLIGVFVFLGCTIMAVIKYLSLLQHTAESVRPR